MNNSFAINSGTSALQISFNSETAGLKFISMTEGFFAFKISTPQKSAPIACADCIARFASSSVKS